MIDASMKALLATEDTLPDTLSGLLAVGLRDFAKLERAKTKYVVDMGRYHFPLGDGRCAACVAGSVMIYSLGVKADDEIAGPWDFRNRLAGKIRAIDYLRLGATWKAARFLKLSAAKRNAAEPFSRDITPYNVDPARFKSDLRRLLRDLRAAGI